MDINALWKQTTTAPVVGGIAGKKVFSIAFSRFAPYFSTIGATVTVLEPNHVELVIPNKKKVHNHIGTVHAIALCNLAELSGGMLTDASIPDSMRWIPRGMTVEYLAKARGTMHAVATPDAPAVEAPAGYAWPVRISVCDDAGEEVFRARIEMWLSPRRRD